MGMALPVPSNVAEQAVFDFVPFAGARWVVAHFNSQTRFVG
jgi:hypothetical protein